MKYAVAFLLAGAVFSLAGCANKVDTPSGSPEVTIQGVRPEQVKPALLNAVLNRRLRIKQDTPHLLVVEKDTQNLAVGVLFSTGLGGVPVERYSFAIAEVPAGTRVVADAMFISNAGTAYERVTFNRSSLNTPELQGLLDEVAASVPRSPPLAPPIASRRPARQVP